MGVGIETYEVRLVFGHNLLLLTDLFACAWMSNDSILFGIGLLSCLNDMSTDVV